MPRSDQATSGPILTFGPFRLDPVRRQLFCDNAPVGLGGRALDLLIYLSAHAGDIVSKRELLAAVWPDVVIEDVTLRAHMAALRRALRDGKDGARYVVSVSGRGYTFVASIQRTDASAGVTERASLYAAHGNASSLPAPQNLVGRDLITEELLALLKNRRFLSIVGPGGIGKTSVAVAIANRLIPDFGRDNIHFVDLSMLSNASEILTSILSAIGTAAIGRDDERSLFLAFEGKKALLVFDSCEHIIEPVALLAGKIFSGLPDVHILATSREFLRAEGETVHYLAGLDLPQAELPSAADALSASAVQLFLSKASGSGLQIQLDDTMAPLVVELCSRLDGIPLAIELAASRAGTYGVQGILDLLEAGPILGFRGKRTASSRHQTLKSTLDWSYELLSEDEQELFSELSIFVGHFTYDAVKYVTEPRTSDGNLFENLLANLVDKSLVVVSEISNQVFFRLLDTTRAYAAEELRKRGETNALAKRHALYYTKYLRSEVNAGSGRELAADAQGRYLGNIRRALTWALSDDGDGSIAAELAAASSYLFLGLSLHAEYERWCRTALNLLPSALKDTETELLLLESYISTAITASGVNDDARRAARRIENLAHGLGDDAAVVRGHIASIYLSIIGGNLEEALSASRNALTVAERSGQRMSKVIAHWMAGFAWHTGGNQKEAERHFDAGFSQDLDISTRSVYAVGRDLRQLARILYARTLWLRGHFTRSSKLADKIVSDARASHSPFSFGFSIANLAVVYLWAGEYEAAKEPLESAIAVSRKYSLVLYWAPGLALQGEAMIGVGETAGGINAINEALAAMESHKVQLYVPLALASLARGFIQLGKVEDASQAIENGLERLRTMHWDLWLPDLLRVQGEVFAAQGAGFEQDAERCFLNAIEVAQGQSAISWEAKAAIQLAELWRRTGKSADARAMLINIYDRHPEKSGTSQIVHIQRMIGEIDHDGTPS